MTPTSSCRRSTMHGNKSLYCPIVKLYLCNIFLVKMYLPKIWRKYIRHLCRWNCKVQELPSAATTALCWSPAGRLVQKLWIMLTFSTFQCKKDSKSENKLNRSKSQSEVGGIHSLLQRWPFAPLYTNILPYLPKR